MKPNLGDFEDRSVRIGLRFWHTFVVASFRTIYRRSWWSDLTVAMKPQCVDHSSFCERTFG